MHIPLSRSSAILALITSLAAWPALGATRTYPAAAPCNGTLQACIDAADPGDEIELAFSTANAEDLDIRKSLTLRPAAGHTPTLGNAIPYATTETIEVTVQSLTFSGRLIGLLGPGGGVLRLRAAGNDFPSHGGTAIELRTSTTAGTYGSIDALIEGNTVAIAGGGGSCSDGISVQLYQPGEGASSVVLRGNDVTATNLSQCAGISVYQSDGRLDLTLDRNRVHGSRFNAGISIWSRGGQTQAGLFNNLVHGQSGNVGSPGAIRVSADGSSDMTAHIVNNTVAHNQDGIWVSAQLAQGTRLRGALRNNIAAFNTGLGLGYQSDLAPDFSESHSLLHGNGSALLPPPEPHRRTGDPAFADAAGGDYRLTASSDALNRGLTSALPAGLGLDLGGAARVVGSAIDIGAYEYPQAIVTPAASGGVAAVPALGQGAALLLGTLLGLAGLRRLPCRR